MTEYFVGHNKDLYFIPSANGSHGSIWETEGI